MFGIIVQQGQRLGQKTELHVFLLTAGPEFCLALPTIAVDDVHHLSELSMGSVRTADVLWKASDDELVEENDADKTKLEYRLTTALPHRDKNSAGQQERKEFLPCASTEAKHFEEFGLGVRLFFPNEAVREFHKLRLLDEFRDEKTQGRRNKNPPLRRAAKYQGVFPQEEALDERHLTHV